MQSCSSTKWNNFNKKKHLNLKSKAVYQEDTADDYVSFSEEDVVEENIPFEDQTFGFIEEESTESIQSVNSFESVELTADTFEEIVIADVEIVEDDPDKAERVRQAKINEIKKEMNKTHKWSWGIFIPFVIFIALIGILYFVLNLTNPVAELLYILSIFAGLTMILGFVSSARTIHQAKSLKNISQDENDQLLAKKMINKSVALLCLYLLFPALLIGGLFLFSE